MDNLLYLVPVLGLIGLVVMILSCILGLTPRCRGQQYARAGGTYL